MATILSVLFASCGGGSGSGSESTLPNNDDGGTDSPIVDTPAVDDVTEVPSTGEPTDDPNYILGPLYGDELSIYHATLVMKVLRVLSFAEDGFSLAGVSVGMVVNGLTDYYERPIITDNLVPNGGLVPCLKDDESQGSKSATWNNGGDNYPTQYTSTRMYSTCRHSGLNFGTFNLYDGVVQQSGTADSGNHPHSIQGGNIHVEYLNLADTDEDISVTINGYMTFNYVSSSLETLEITEIDLEFHEDNNTLGGSSRYIEDILVHDGTITFERLEHVSDTGTSYTKGVKHAALRIDVTNNNHEKIALLVTTVEPTRDDVVYSLNIERAENSADPQPTEHAIRIDRVHPPYETPYVYNVYIDFNHNGVIDEIDAYPQEFYEEEALFRDRWGYIEGL
jgi:hypothetical protein